MIPRLIVIGLLGLLPAVSAAQDASGVIAKYLPPKAEHIIVRANGEESTAGLGSPLYAGDTVKVEEGGSLVIAYPDGEREALKGPTTFTVPEGEAMGAAGGIFQRLQVMLGREYRQGSNLATRNPGSCDANTPPLAASVLRPTTYLSVGHANVALAWVGGCAPYSLRLEGAGVELNDLQRPLTRIETTGLAAGNYTLTIGDAQSKSMSVAVILTDPPEGPIDHDSIQTELDAVAYAAWLADYGDGGWRLESFQQIRPWIRDGGAMAGTFGDLIMWGDPDLDLNAAD